MITGRTVPGPLPESVFQVVMLLPLSDLHFRWPRSLRSIEDTATKHRLSDRPRFHA